MSDPLPLRTAEILAIGSELLGSSRLDTNSLFLSERLASLGIELRSKTVVGDNRREVAEHLRRDGLTVEVVASGRKALLRLQSETFDVVVSDLRMPDLDGPSLVAALRQQHPELARRVVLITGDALGAELNEAIRDADLPILEKPLDIDALRGQVHRLLAAA